MKKVITYGSFDFLHYGHIRLLQRAKELGDYLIVGITSEDFDKKRGKINVQQSLSERIEAVLKTGLADKIIVEEYIGQKIDDIKRYDVDIFAIGSDWEGKFDYLKEFCKVVYLPRTKGISSTEIRTKNNEIKIGLVGNDIDYLKKYKEEDLYVNGIKVVGICCKGIKKDKTLENIPIITDNIDEVLDHVDALFVDLALQNTFDIVEKALKAKKHVLCESPICGNKKECEYLFKLAKENNVILMDAIRVAYSTAYSRLLLLIKGGEIGNVLSVDSTITSLSKQKRTNYVGSFANWGTMGILPVLDLLGHNYKEVRFHSKFKDKEQKEDLFTKIDFTYDGAVASVKVADGAKSAGELIITGTLGYIYVPAPWWKTDYFEVIFEDANKNKKYFYELEGEGIRYQLLSFIYAIHKDKKASNISYDTSLVMCELTEKFLNKSNMFILK